MLDAMDAAREQLLWLATSSDAQILCEGQIWPRHRSRAPRQTAAVPDTRSLQ